MKKIIMTLAVAFVLALVSTTKVSAVTIDGSINPAGEWAGATIIPVASSMGTVSVITDTNFMYVLFDVIDSTDARLGQNLVGNDAVGLNINPTNGGSWGFPYDIIFQTGADPNAWGGNDSGMSDGWHTNWSIKVGGVTTPQATLPAGLETMTTYSGGHRISEWKLPLASISGLQSGDTLKVGGAIDVGDGNSYVFPVALDWGSYSTFETVLIPEVPYLRTAAITAPLSGANVYGNVNFAAYLNDDDPDPIQWAVRPGTCASGAPSVFGNVDGLTNSATINMSNLADQTFSFTGDMSAMPLGLYCFVYNPTEDAGESGIRLTSEFNLVAPPMVMPTDKEQCKKGGWDIFGVFKNQGDCVSFVATGGRNLPAGN